jgi:hypothetical protein
MGERKWKKSIKLQWMKYIILTAIVVLVVCCLAIYVSPFVTYYEVESAIAAKDAGKLASYTDLKELRKNLKVQKGQRIIRDWKKGDGKEPGNEQSLVDLSIQWAAFPSDLAIDQAISTEGFYISLSGATKERRRPDPIRPPSELSSYQMIRKLTTCCSFEYQSYSKFVVRVKDDKNRYAEYFSFVFTREGLNWRMTSVVLPLF